MARETWIQSQVESYQRLKKWCLMLPCLTLSIIRYESRVKWSHPEKEVAPSPIPWCSSYRKGRLGVTLDYGRQLYFTLYLVYMQKQDLALYNQQRLICHRTQPNPFLNSFIWRSCLPCYRRKWKWSKTKKVWFEALSSFDLRNTF